jgi:hypothetical protein
LHTDGKLPNHGKFTQDIKALRVSVTKLETLKDESNLSDEEEGSDLLVETGEKRVRDD